MTAAPSPRVCFVTCVRWPDVSESDGFVQRALEARGATVTARAWNAPEARFDGFDVVVFRSNWDYHHDPEPFLAWLARWEVAGVPFWNPPTLIRWNLSKRYLRDLEKAGLPVVPTVILEEGEAGRLPSVMAERGWRLAVVKPVLSASAHDTTLVPAADAATAARAIAEGRIRQPAMVQPFVEEIRRKGEWSLVFIDGSLTHAVLKHPGAGDFRVQPRFGGRAAEARPEAGVAAVGRRALDALPLAPLYARVDGVVTARGFMIMEVELHEPGLFFPLAPAAAEIFAHAILERTRQC
jgi:glutathione synthase/RimK-type ligase-like ATP-grasp enzyme